MSGKNGSDENLLQEIKCISQDPVEDVKNCTGYQYGCTNLGDGCTYRVSEGIAKRKDSVLPIVCRKYCR